jgi:hypothetical protein
MKVTRRIKQSGSDFMKTPVIDISELTKLHDDFVFNKFKEEFKKIGIEIKSIDCFKELKEDLLQVDFDESINVFYKKEPLFIYPSFKMWLGKNEL